MIKIKNDNMDLFEDDENTIVYMSSETMLTSFICKFMNEQYLKGN